MFGIFICLMCLNGMMLLVLVGNLKLLGLVGRMGSLKCYCGLYEVMGSFLNSMWFFGSSGVVGW